jgi:hypothetical protein
LLQIAEEHAGDVKGAGGQTSEGLSLANAVKAQIASANEVVEHSKRQVFITQQRNNNFILLTPVRFFRAAAEAMSHYRNPKTSAIDRAQHQAILVDAMDAERDATEALQGLNAKLVALCAGGGERAAPHISSVCLSVFLSFITQTHNLLIYFPSLFFLRLMEEGPGTRLLEGIDVNKEQLLSELKAVRNSSQVLLSKVGAVAESMKSSNVIEAAAALWKALTLVEPLQVHDPVYPEMLHRNPKLCTMVLSAITPVIVNIEAASKVLVTNVGDMVVAEQTGRDRWHNDQVLASQVDFPLGDGPYVRMVNKLLDGDQIKKFTLDTNSRFGKALLKLKAANDNCLRLLGR